MAIHNDLYDIHLSNQDVANALEALTHQGMTREISDGLLDYARKHKAKIITVPYATPGGQSIIPSGPYWRSRLLMPDGRIRRIMFNMETWDGKVTQKWHFA